ncbi:hypothetical protein ACFPRL_18950 [Pseudoclavibacter helvolus]
MLSSTSPATARSASAQRGARTGLPSRPTGLAAASIRSSDEDRRTWWLRGRGPRFRGCRAECAYQRIRVVGPVCELDRADGPS